MPKAKVNGIETFYEVTGNGYPLVFIHGGDLESSSWNSQVACFSQSYKVITYDIRGHGQSQIPELNYSISECVEDLYQLLDLLAIDQAFLVGLSMGGYITLSFTLKYPERVAGIILEGSNSGKVTESQKRMSKNKVARMRKERSEKAIKFIKAHEANVNRPDLTIRLAEIQKPALIIVGDKDVITPSYISETMHKELANSRLVVLPNCGHRCHEEQPDTFNSIVSDFLKTIEAP